MITRRRLLQRDAKGRLVFRRPGAPRSQAVTRRSRPIDHALVGACVGAPLRATPKPLLSYGEWHSLAVLTRCYRLARGETANPDLLRDVAAIFTKLGMPAERFHFAMRYVG